MDHPTLRPCTLFVDASGAAAERDALCRLIDETCTVRDRDLRQEILMVCLRKLDSAAGRKSDVRNWADWVRGVAWRLMFASLRDKAYQHRAETFRGVRLDAAAAETPFDHAVRIERRDAVRDALAALPALARAAVIRVDMNDESYATVASDLYGSDDKAARQRLGTLLHRARRKLREALQSCGPAGSMGTEPAC